MLARKRNPSKATRDNKAFDGCFFSSLDSSEALICTDSSKTVSGRTCQHWNSNFPHEPNDKMRSRLGFTEHNFCAVADEMDERPFCYTTDPTKRWEYCDCKPCDRTESGSQCMRWDSNHYHIKYSSGGSFYLLLA